MARWFVSGFGLLVICVGAFGLVQPLGLKGFSDVFLTSSGLWFASVLRGVGLMAIAMGAFFVWSVWPRRRES